LAQKCMKMILDCRRMSERLASEGSVYL
jgi:hypothetical protein